MFNINKREINFCNKTLTLESGKLARQADGSILATYGNAQILATVVYQKDEFAINDFLPLTVVYQEKYYAIGKFPGGFFKREGKLSDNEVLISRLIDRSIRPLFHKSFFNEIQVVCTVLSHDSEVGTDFLAMAAAIAAIRSSGAPFLETIAGIRVGYDQDKKEFFVNTRPGTKTSPDNHLNMFVSGNKESILMVESEANSLDEPTMIQGIEFAIQNIAPLIDLIDNIAGDINGAKGIEPLIPAEHDTTKLAEDIRAHIEERLQTAYQIPEKQERTFLLSEASKETIEHFSTKTEAYPGINTEKKLKFFASGIIYNLKKNIIRQKVIDTGKRLDGRNTNEVRQIEIETNFLKECHGSALFTRGETQALAVITLGCDTDEQTVDTIHGLTKDNFLLHYNFPSFSVGEVGRFGPPGRREIGHGNLARKSLISVVPTKVEFPQCIRIVSEILESNGSSSMATVCASSLAMLAAGVPIKNPVSGIAMGLILENDEFVILSDIMGDEDALGDMDFKVAGTENGITALQMDIKVIGVTAHILAKAIDQAKDGRLHILNKMNAILKEPLKNTSPSIPSRDTIKIPETKIKQVLGSGGSVIKDICAKSNCSIDVGRDGNISMFGTQGGIDIAKKMISDIALNGDGDRRGGDRDGDRRGGDRDGDRRGGDRDGDRRGGDRDGDRRGGRDRREGDNLGEIGTIVEGVVKKILDHGAIIELPNEQTGLAHISELSLSRINRVEDIIEVGEAVKAKIIEDHNGRQKLSLKSVDQVTGKDISHLSTRNTNRGPKN